SVSLDLASLLLPLGFFLGGLWHYAGDPGLGVLLVPVGGALLVVAALLVLLGLRAPPPPCARGLCYREVVSTARKLATYDDLLAYPEDVKTEIFDGEIHVQPSALPGHGRAQLGLGRLIGGPYDGDGHGPGGWWIMLELDVRLDAHNVVRPDLSG